MEKKKRGLTDKQYNFALLVGSLKCSSTEAYRRVYDCERMKPATIRREASRLLSNHNVATTIESIKKEHHRNKIALSLSDSEKVYSRLREWIDNPPDKDKGMMQLRAIELMAKVLGLGNSQNINMNVSKNEDSSQIRDKIENLLGSVELSELEEKSEPIERNEEGGPLH
tara:strand:+ start:150 stop:656 length:507 start_codon:yes stop_codon:yes gene_type:complete